MNEAKGLSPELVSSDSSSQSWRTPRGAMSLTWTEQGAIYVSVDVHGDRSLSPLMVRRADTLIARTRMKFFFDFWQMPTYDSEMRTEWTGFLVTHRARVDEIHVVARSKLVAMGVAVANLALGGIIKSYPAPTGPFERALNRAGLKLPVR
ncbi:MAG TPA: hypothetical protein VG937_13625 [Polyangiaceae bacterium]|nr:hypothetical protein [Polyangiaceae bacterium]